MLSAVAATTLSWQAGATSSLVAGPVAGTVAGRSPLRAAVRALVDDKAEVEEYFNNVGFERWNKIYSEDGEVNKVQLDIRTGHGIRVEKVLGWVDRMAPPRPARRSATRGAASAPLPSRWRRVAPR